MNLNFSFAQKTDQDQLLALLNSRNEESRLVHPEKQAVDLVAAAEVFSTILTEPNVKIILGKIAEQVVATVTLFYLPRVRAGGYVVILEDVLVKKELRGQGVGSELMKFAIEHCKSDSRVKKIKLGTRKDATQVHQFYEKLGFSYQENLMQLSLS